MLLEFSPEFKEVIAKLNNSEFLDPSHRIMISTRPIDMGVLVESIKNTKHNVIALTINSIKLTGDEIEKLEDVFTHCTSLENLDLSNNDLTSKEAEILAGILANNKTIQSLSLNNNKIGDNGLKAFAKIAEKSPVTFLNFSDNNISDRGFKYWLAAHKKNSNLVEFHFDNNKIHNEGIEALIHFLKFNDSVKSFHVGTEQVEEPNTTNVTLETYQLLTKLVEEKEIEAFLKTSDTLLPDALDVWVEEVIPEPEPQEPVSLLPVANLIPALQPTEQLVNEASSVSPVISNYTEAGSVTNETTPQQEIIVENKFNPTLELLDKKYNSKFYSLLEGYNNSLDKQSMKPNSALKETQAVIVFGNSTNDKNILTNLLAHKTLKLEESGGKLIIASSSSKFSQDIILSNKPVINIIKGVDGLIVCDSNYLQDNLSKSEATVNALYLQKIVSNNTKFILTMQDSEDKFTNMIDVRGSDFRKEFLSQVKKLAILLEKIPLTENNFSLVVTSHLAYRDKKDIFEYMEQLRGNHALRWTFSVEEEKNLIKKEVEIIAILRYSICIVRPFSCGELTLGKDLQAILNKPLSILTNADNKITMSSADISDILTLQSYIKEGLRDGISKLSDKIKTKWEKEKASLFTLETKKICDGRMDMPNTEALKKLQGIFKWLKNPGNDSSNNNIIDNDTAKFLALNNALYNVLTNKESSELNVKLSSYVDYLKYFTAIKCR
ncbi:hypothetical protein [Rickettsia endosymbiont of Polydrusus tereticollis]|uniref:hypothetical protein n=1 Tax=Rickettsia endosymbiont of Polydrusus tereticollis TaxID=3066251 RepID=UPI00313304EC